MKKLIVIFVLTLAMVSCTSVSSTRVGSSQVSIVSTDWVLAENVNGKTPTLSIEQGKVHGNAGCNSYVGEIKIDPSKGSFSIKQIATTKLYCTTMDVEKNFVSVLSEANRYVVSENILELYQGNLLLMKFKKK